MFTRAEHRISQTILDIKAIIPQPSNPTNNVEITESETWERSKMEGYGKIIMDIPEDVLLW